MSTFENSDLPSPVLFEFSELVLMNNALNEILNGPGALKGEEFQSITGATVEDAENLLIKLRRAIEKAQPCNQPGRAKRAGYFETLDLKMPLIHEKTNHPNDYHYYRTDRSVTVQIGRGTTPGAYAWSIFHPDIKCAIWGGESQSLEHAEGDASAWVSLWVEAINA